MAKKYFGTDGIRGKVGQSPITADFFLKLGWAIGNVFANEHKGFVLVGKDTRISGYMFESALEAGLSAAGMDTRLLGPMPTPAIAYLTRTLRAKAGIVISASHNPYYDNGVKFFSVAGNKLADDLEYQIEAYLDSHMTTVTSAELGKAKRVDDAPGRYIEFCKATIPTNLDFNGLKIVLDCANGATYHIAPPVLSEIGATVHCLGCQPNGLNINDGCGSTHLQALINTVKDQQADLGIAFDGDGDRVMMVDHCGEIVDGDELLYIIAASRLKHQGLRAPVVGTLMSNLGLEQALASLQIPFIRAKVGDRYVRAQLQQHRGILGGENSGHIICLDRTTTGDGIVSALQVLESMRDSGQSLHQLKRAMCKYPQVLVNVIADRKIDLNHPIIVQAVTEVERQLGDQGRVLLRASGTEPLVRIMVEGAEANLVSQLAEQLAQIIKKLMSA